MSAEIHPAARTTLRTLSPSARLVAQAWLGTRLLLIIVAVLVAIRSGRPLTDVLGNWDVAHFVAIARNGYAVATDVAFFPGLPLLLRAGMLLGLSPIVTGVLLSLVGSALATWALFRLGGPWAAGAWLLAPTSVFTLVPYTESPFCAAAFWAWDRARARDWRAAGLLAALACTLRVSGLFLIGALAILAVTRAFGARLHLGRSLPWLLLPVATLASYAVFLYEKTGSWTAWFSAQAAGWERSLTSPWDCFWHSWASVQPGAYADHPGWVWIFRGEMVSMLVGLVVLGGCLAKRWWAEAAWVGVQLLAFSLSYWYQSVNRAVLLWFPLWMLLGSFIGRRRAGSWRLVWIVLAVLALVVQTVWAVLFYTGMWAS